MTELYLAAALAVVAIAGLARVAFEHAHQPQIPRGATPAQHITRRPTMSVRAKMKCTEIATRAVDVWNPETKQSRPGTNEVVKLCAAMGDENKPWSQYTPQATVELWITNPDAVAQFKVGGMYFVDFTPAE